MRRRFVAVSILGACLGADAQVHKCIDAAGKISYSQQPCMASQRGGQVLGDGATMRRTEEEEAYQAQRNRASLARTLQQQHEMIEGPVQERQPAIERRRAVEAPSEEPHQEAIADREGCETYSTRKGCMGGDRARNPNWSARRGYYGGGGPADQRHEVEAERARQDAAAAASRAPGRLSNCTASGCSDGAGNRYNRTGDGSKFWRSDGKFCTSSGSSWVTCN